MSSAVTERHMAWEKVGVFAVLVGAVALIGAFAYIFLGDVHRLEIGESA